MKRGSPYPNKLRQLRGRRFTQEEMAELLQVHPSTYRSWEDGTHRPRPRHIRALCRHLGVHEYELGYIASSPNSTPQPDLRTSPTDLPPAVQRSQERWLEVRHYLAHHGSDLL